MSVKELTPVRPSARPDARTRRALPAASILAGLVLLSAGLRSWAALRVPSPWFVPDEMVYGELGKALYKHGRLEILGGSTAFYSAVYPAFVGLPLSFGHAGYTTLKVLQAFVLSLTALPVYLWGRSLCSRGWALVAAGLTLALPGLAFAGFLMTEVVFIPLVTLAAWATARALERPTLVRQAVVLVAIAVAVATRLQALVLVPVLVLAVLLKAALDRTWLRGVRPFAAMFGGLVAVAALGLVVKLVQGGSALGSTLGAYRATAETSYSVGHVTRFVLYHMADVLLMTAVVPAFAVALLACRAAAGREPDAGVRAYLAVAISLAAGLVVQVGIFTSALTGRLAERNLLGLAPVLLVGFAVWLDRGLPRPRLATAGAIACALALLAALPWSRFVVEAGEPDSFSLIPLYRLRVAHPGIDLRTLVLVVAVALLGLAALLPARLGWLLPACVAVLLAGASVEVSRVVARQARLYATVVGPQTDWIDDATSRPVAVLHAGELRWTGGALPWVSLFWNDRVNRVYDLFGTRVLGPVPQTQLRVDSDGRLLLPGGTPAPTQAVAAPIGLNLAGRPLAVSSTQHQALWQPDPPLRLSTRTTGVTLGGDIRTRATLTAYDCTRGALALRLLASGDGPVELRRNGKPWHVVRLRSGEVWTGSIPALPRAGSRLCTFAVVPTGPLRATRLEFVRSG